MNELDGLAPEDMLVVPRERWERLKRFTLGLVHALYDGVPGQAEPQSDADVLRYVADWLDRADDARDGYLDEHREAGGRGREVQHRLRAIADRLDVA